MTDMQERGVKMPDGSVAQGRVIKVVDQFNTPKPLTPEEARNRCREVETLVAAVRKMQLHPIGVLSEVHEAMRPFTREEKRE